MKRSLSVFGVAAGYLLLTGATVPSKAAQDDPMRFRVDVVLVQLNVAVTDDKGNYITGLRPEDFVVTEDKIPEKISTFEESTEVHKHMLDGSADPGAPAEAAKNAATDADASGALAASRISDSVFILFDTSNYMYRSFVFAQDAIADFVRSMDGYGKIAFYSYSRNLLRATTLTSDRFRLENGVRSTVAGDDAALYNSLLLTVQDAAPLRGRKAIVVFSNGPDNASAVPPEDVAELAQSTGTLIYIISTRQAQDDPASAAAFERMSRVSGGKAYFAKNWREEKNAFASIRDDLAHLYTLSYYPQPNPNRGWRSISVKLVGKNLQKYHLRTRDGYRLLPANSKVPPPGPEARDNSGSR
ncbi:VWA domain-containing protein [Acidobacteria bacterium AB60]|nr:VWA domain-containing protein [Acidobacteria bacterium AB60]